MIGLNWSAKTGIFALSMTLVPSYLSPLYSHYDIHIKLKF